MNNLQHEVMKIIKHNKDGSFATRAKRRQVLMRAARLLWEKFPGLKLQNLQQKHLLYLIELWKPQKSAKTKMSHIRWLLEKINKEGLLPKNNDSIGIVRRKVVSNENKTWLSKTDIEAKLQEVSDADQVIGLVLRLCLLFGLRLKEAMLLRPHENNKQQYLEVIFGTKGSRPRNIPILSPEQTQLLKQVEEIIGDGRSLIPTNWSFIQFRNRFYYVMRKSGISKKNDLTIHGLRHTYACKRYEDITCSKAPVLTKKEDKIIDIEKDHKARETISKELGHGRSSVTSAYIGGLR